jgi:hypothetical protein
MSRHLFTLDSLSPARQQEVMAQLHPTHGKDQDRREVSHPQPEPAVRHASMESVQREENGPACRSGRITVHVRSFRRRTLDIDNCTGGAKYILDSIRYAKLIPDDRPEDITLSVDQVKVKGKEAERTEIEITYP